MNKRRRELALLLWPALVLGTGYGYGAVLKGPFVFLGSYEVTLLIAGFFGVHFILEVSGHQGDEYLFPLAAMLTAVGLVFLFRLDPALAKKQVAWCMIGLLVLVATVIGGRDYERLTQYPYFYLILGLFFLLLTVVAGTRIGGA
ncbi:MAG: hypothetical protein ACPLQP_02940, partial [Moorellaceae bacterium]